MNRKVRLDLVALEEGAFNVLGRLRREAMEQASSPDAITAVINEATVAEHDHPLRTRREHTEPTDNGQRSVRGKRTFCGSFRRRSHLIDATAYWNRSAGASYRKVFLGRLLGVARSRSVWPASAPRGRPLWADIALAGRSHSHWTLAVTGFVDRKSRL